VQQGDSSTLGAGYIYKQNISPTGGSNIAASEVRFNNQLPENASKVYIHEEDDTGYNLYNAFSNVMNFVNAGGGNYARFLIAADVLQKAISFKVTGGSYNSTLDYFEFDLAENIFVDTVKCPGYNTFVLEAGDTKLEVWMWRSDGAGGYSTTTTTTFSTSTLTTFNTVTVYNTSKSTQTTFSTSKSTSTNRNTSESRSTTTTFNTLRSTITQYNAFTLYNTFRSTFTSGGGGGGCSRGCI
tara:strand:+ start:5100 stop:5819 length:720 start_codon:yes stop_codon:yes gene_type:complete